MSAPCRSALICHDSEPLNRLALARWLASFTDLAALIVLQEPKARLRKRIRREVKRVGPLRFVDVLAFRAYSRIFLDRANQQWERQCVQRIEAQYAPIPASTRVLNTPSPNSPETEQLLKEVRPDIIIARCKNILNERIFGQARIGTFVMHPGICPEYRNAHGCFWALANGDTERVGMTLLKIDKGVDTGPVYGYFTYPYEQGESHIVIQNRVVFDNLDPIRTKLEEILAGSAKPICTNERRSGEWVSLGCPPIFGGNAERRAECADVCAGSAVSRYCRPSRSSYERLPRCGCGYLQT